MNQKSSHPEEDLQAIRVLMERSSRFLSLSGLSGIIAGLFALTGAAVAWFRILDSGKISYLKSMTGQEEAALTNTRFYLTIDALIVLVAALTCAVYFSHKNALKAGQPIWSNASRRLLLHFLIPLITGGIFIVLLLVRNNLELVAPSMLIFYGLSMINAGKFTFSEIQYLGLTEIALGILAVIFFNQGLLFWTIGFGVVHLIYGTLMYYRYERNGKSVNRPATTAQKNSETRR